MSNSSSREKQEGTLTAREDSATLREDAADAREEAAGVREKASTLREKQEGAVTAREDTATLREDAAGVREEAAGVREKASTLREDTATLREDAAGIREEAVQTRQDLRDSRDLLAQTGRLAKVGGWQLDVDTQTLLWTEEVYRIHEVDPASKPTVAEAIQFYASEARPVIAAAVQAAIDAGTPFDLELPLMTARGRHLSVRALGIAERRDGKTIRIYGAFQDITERKRSEEDLRRFATVVRDSNDSITIQDFEGRITAWNRGAQLMYGYSEAEALLANIERLTAPSKIAEQREFIRRLIAGEAITSFETQRVTKDGRVLDVWMTVTKLVDDAGHPIGLASTERDITEHKRAEKDLRASELRYRALIEQATDGIFVINSDHQFVEVNPAGCELLGRTASEVLQLTIHDVVGSSPDAPLRLRDLSGGRTIIGEREAIRKDGTRVPIEISAKQLQDGRAQGIVRDITERKGAEKEKAILEAQYRQAQKMEAVGRLAGGVAHDFNNMLGVILGHAELAAEHVDPAQPLWADIEEIRNAAVRSAALVRQLLAFARKQTVLPRVLDVNDTVAGMLTMLRRLIGEDIDLQWQPGVDLWAVNMDPSQLDQVLANLCVNARDAISGVGTLTIGTGNSTLDAGYCAAHPGCTPGSYVRLRVDDNGCGMDKDTLTQIFEPFFTTKATGEGTGLGLATVFGAVKQNDGSIDVVSEPGRGTTFTIYLPRHAGAAPEVQTEGAATPPPRGHETILLVEDEPSVLRLSTRILEHQGYTVLATGRPEDALRLAHQHTGEINLLITDVIMPEMNGRTLAKNLLAFTPHLKCLFMSGYTADVIAHHGVLDQGIQFLQKPFSTEALASKVRDALNAQN